MIANFIPNSLSNRVPPFLGIVLGLRQFIIYLLLSAHCVAQKPNTSYYTAEDFSLQNPDKKINPYEVEVDSLGFVYMVGPAGVHRFNGREMVKLNQIDGTYTHIFKDAQQNLWVKRKYKGIFQILGDSLRPWRFNDSIRKLVRTPLDMYFDAAGMFYLGDVRKGLIRVSKEGRLHKKRPKIHGFVISRLEDGRLFFYSSVADAAEALNVPVSIYFEDANGEFKELVKTSGVPYGHRPTLLPLKDGSFLFSTGRKTIIRAKQDSLIEHYEMPSNVYSLFMDSREQLWVGTVTDGLHKVDDQFRTIEQLFGDGPSSVEAEDLYGGLWLSVGAPGFAYIPNPKMYRYSAFDGQLKSNEVGKLNTDYKQLFFTTPDGSVQLDGDELTYLPQPSRLPLGDDQLPLDKPSVHFYDTSIQAYCMANTKVLCKWDGNAWESQSIAHQRFTGHILHGMNVMDENVFMGITNRDFFRLTDNRTEIIYSMPRGSMPIQSFSKIDEKTYWIGTTKGLKKWNGDTLEEPKLIGISDRLKSSSVYQLREVADRLWVQSDNGIYVLDKKGQSEEVLDPDGQPIQLLELFLSDKDEVWGRRTGASHKMLVRLAVKEGRVVSKFYAFDDLALEYYRTFAGQLAVVKDTVYLGTSGGLFKTAVDDLVEQGPAPLGHISGLSINYQPVQAQAVHQLSHDQNTLNIDFDAISFRLEPVLFRYRLLGLDSVWRSAKYNGIQYTGLLPGDYLFELQCKVKGGNWGAKKSVQFLIAEPYWQSWWFISIMVLSAILILVVSLSLWFSNRQKKTLLQLDKLRAEHNSLRAQMNPHFVYNALNSAQKFLLMGQIDDYNEFMAQLSQLLRSGLENARLEFIPLSHELQFIDNYLKIESKRFPDRFSIAINLDPQLEAEKEDIAIPSMMIQPLCENAIKYAFDGNPVKIKLQLSLLAEDLIEAKIIDDGVGYQNKQSVTKAKNKRTSLGLRILSERISILQKQGYTASMKMRAMEEKSGRGTVVILILPIQ